MFLTDMMPDEFKQGLRNMTMEIFDNHERFLVTTLGIENRLIPEMIGGMLAIMAPVTLDGELCQFFKDEGLGVVEITQGAFIVSQEC